MHDEDEFPHSHDSEAMEGAEDIEGLEMFTLHSVGIDIGSSTSHLVFSKLTLRREGAAFSSRFSVSAREMLYRSSIMLTPYSSGTLIDTDKVRAFVQSAYKDAGVTPEQVDTGAVVITGEALNKENARPITEMFAEESGKFICASAGPNHEALLAAHGCGAVAISKAENATVLNLDMGGGTTKFSLIRQGVVTGTAAISVGARLIAFDSDGTLTRVEKPAETMMGSLGKSVVVGQKVDEVDKEAFAKLQASVLAETLRGGELSPLAQSLLVTTQLPDYSDPREIDYVVCSGGVSEYVYEHESTSYGDVGPWLGKYIRQHLEDIFKDGTVREPTEGIRATVIGAGEYTIQASGNTSHLSGAAALPAYALQVVRPLIRAEGSVEEALRLALAKFDLPSFAPGLALALSLNDDAPTYKSLRRIAEGIHAIATNADSDTPLFIVLDMDVAKSLGGILTEELGIQQGLIVVDGIEVGDLDYLDIGRPMSASEVLPVTVKSLMFPSEG
jgi:ethanolamine utilization protein EutA